MASYTMKTGGSGSSAPSANWYDNYLPYASKTGQTANSYLNRDPSEGAYSDWTNSKEYRSSLGTNRALSGYGSALLSKAGASDPYGTLKSGDIFAGQDLSNFPALAAKMGFKVGGVQPDNPNLAKWMSNLQGGQRKILDEAARSMANAGTAAGRGGMGVAGGASAASQFGRNTTDTIAGRYAEDFDRSVGYEQQNAEFSAQAATAMINAWAQKYGVDADLLKSVYGADLGTGSSLLGKAGDLSLALAGKGADTLSSSQALFANTGLGLSGQQLQALQGSDQSNQAKAKMNMDSYQYQQTLAEQKRQADIAQAERDRQYQNMLANQQRTWTTQDQAKAQALQDAQTKAEAGNTKDTFINQMLARQQAHSWTGMDPVDMANMTKAQMLGYMPTPSSKFNTPGAATGSKIGSPVGQQASSQQDLSSYLAMMMGG